MKGGVGGGSWNPFSVVLVALVLILGGLLFYRSSSSTESGGSKKECDGGIVGIGLVGRPDILRDPYLAPMKDDGGFYLMSKKTNVGYVDVDYGQIGMLVPRDGGKGDGEGQGELLALLGRPLFSNRQKWNYYCISNQHNNIKMPLRVKGRRSTYEYGVDELYEGDYVAVEGKGGKFRVVIYDKERM
jgi:hypothetical protein